MHYTPAVVLTLFYFSFNHHFYCPAQLVGGFTLSDLLDKPWSQVSCLLPLGTCLHVKLNSERCNTCDTWYWEYEHNLFVRLL